MLAEAIARKVISIHAPLAGRDAVRIGYAVLIGISIHAPLAGRDPNTIAHTVEKTISIHAPLAGRDRVPASSRG